jgi:hypothetical protein
VEFVLSAETKFLHKESSNAGVPFNQRNLCLIFFKARSTYMEHFLLNMRWVFQRGEIKLKDQLFWIVTLQLYGGSSIQQKKIKIPISPY